MSDNSGASPTKSEASSLPLVALVGRPNTGKSTLFNRLLGKRIALVHPMAGVTRDWREEVVKIERRKIRLRDTAGLGGDTNPEIAEQIDDTTREIINDADVCVLLIDSQTGILPVDEALARLLHRRHQRNVVLVANKVERRSDHYLLGEYGTLGFGDAIAVSAEHGLGVGDLREAICDLLPPQSKRERSNTHPASTDATSDHASASASAAVPAAAAAAPLPSASTSTAATANESGSSEELNFSPVSDPASPSSANEQNVTRSDSQRNIDDSASPRTNDSAPHSPLRRLQVAIIGRPNAGKSTLINQFLGENRMTVGKQPGITRDTIGHDLQWGQQPVHLLDTAGIRRQRSVNSRIERLMVSQALRASRMAEVTLILIDSTEPLASQDVGLAARAVEEGRAIVVGLNKVDIARTGNIRELRRRLDESLPQLGKVEIVEFSADTGKGIARLRSSVLRSHSSWNKRVDTGPLNRWLSNAISRHPPPVISGRRPTLKYITQIKSRPPTFVVFCQRPSAVDTAYRRYLVNGLREQFEMDGVPIRLIIRARENPYVSSPSNS